MSKSRLNEERFFKIFRTSPNAVTITRASDGKFLDVNDAFFAISGFTREEALDDSSIGLKLWVDIEDRRRVLAVLAEGKDVTGREFLFRNKNGSIITGLFSAQVIQLENESCVLSSINDITERNRMEEALRRSEDKFRILFEQAADSILLLEITNEGVAVIRDANSVAFRILGYDRDELIGRPVSLLDAAPDASKAVGENRHNIVSGKMSIFEMSHRCKDGTIRDFECSVTEMQVASGTFAISVERDITERKRMEAKRRDLEAQLQRTQKMEAVGILAGGVAHDFNNMLSVILVYTGFAMDSIPTSDPLRNDLLEVKKAGERAAVLTRQLLAFSRKQVLQPVPLNLNQIVEGVDKMLRRILGEDIDLVQNFAPDLGLTLADPGQIEQVIMNLAVNAREAMPEGGKLTIETVNATLDTDHARHDMDVKPGPYIMVSVTDSGAGMDEQTMGRIFEPFFTTKGLGKGTGLGLSTVYGIVKQSGGTIFVDSEVGRGTSFKIYLPREFTVTPVKIAGASKVPRPAVRTETILVVDDEEALCNIAARALGAVGHTVLTARDGDEALLTSAGHSGDIHLLLTDVVMPRMNGRTLASELSKSRPTVRVLYMSGYTDDAILHHGVLDAGTHFLSKPFAADDLIRKVQDVLDDGTADVADKDMNATSPETATTEQSFDRYALGALPGELRENLFKAVIAARYDEIIEISQTIRVDKPDLAAEIVRMADLFDYVGIRNLLGKRKEA